MAILGEPGTGKTRVALRVASDGGLTPVYLDTRALQEEIVRRTRTGAWAPRIVEAPALVLDGPIFLTSRRTAAQFLRELLALRIKAGRRTVLCEVSKDGSLDRVLRDIKAGGMATIGLRFPASRSGRMRFARRCCDELGLGRSSARGTDLLEPWGYEAVVSTLRALCDQSAPVAVAQR